MLIKIVLVMKHDGGEFSTIYAKGPELIHTKRRVSESHTPKADSSLPKTVFQLSTEPPTPKFAHAANT